MVRKSFELSIHVASIVPPAHGGHTMVVEGVLARAKGRRSVLGARVMSELSAQWWVGWGAGDSRVRACLR